MDLLEFYERHDRNSRIRARKNLRKKLQLADAEIEIESIYGIGYKLVEK